MPRRREVLLKRAPPGQIVEPVRRAAAGDPVLSPDVPRSVTAVAARTRQDGCTCRRQADDLSALARLDLTNRIQLAILAHESLGR